MNIWLICFGAFCALGVLILAIAPLRRQLVSRWVMRIFLKSMPKMSRTEREALESGTVGFEGELFSGQPDFKKLLSLPSVKLSVEEQTFLDGPVEELCRMVSDWDVTRRKNLSPEVWDFLRRHGFFGLIIPKQFGGKGFSAWAHSRVLAKTGSRCVPLAVTIAVPNSLGPGELLVRYGTDAQKKHHLPRLARGEDIPCFALTGPTAGSDASSIPDTGVICRDTFEGIEQVGIRLNWNKRYITLAPVASLVGLAFQLEDPEHLLSDVEELGITCALVPARLPGVTIGRRHDPSGVPFLNGPTQGREVFIPLDYIIGGPKMAGQGWRMLMECLGAGRGITLPSSAASGAAAIALASGAYARIREQFRLPLAKFEGIQEPLARIAANAYVNTSTLRLMIGAIDAGEEPPVASAITKYHTTERYRQVVNDAMDIHGGKGICLGPNNYLSSPYHLVPINITVEGANILTRNVIIFGQGAIRCHPYILREMHAAEARDIEKFDAAFFRHLFFVFKNATRSFTLGLFGSKLCAAPRCETRRYFQAITRLSSAFAFAVDVSVLALGASLKRRESISARLGDVVSNLYLASAVLKRFHEDGSPRDEMPVIHWVCRDLICRAEEALAGVCYNLPNRFIGFVLRVFVLPKGRCHRGPDDRVTHQIAQLLTTPSKMRECLAQGLFLSPSADNPLYRLEDAFLKISAAEAVEQRIKDWAKKNNRNEKSHIEMATEAMRAGVINADELKQMIVVDELRSEIIAVDDFAAEDL